ncbi:MAG TPA: hypothetical protein VFA75_20250 [Nevskia sp.]|nr:hypothetical protein [Nevskia sp.]
MKKLRALLVLLLCLALPWAALAGGMQNMQCRHHGMQHGHGGMTAALPAQHRQQADPDCGHAQKCECQHHCAGSAVAAFLAAGPHLPAPAGAGFEPGRDLGLVAAAWASFPFRPPIAAPSGAA